jgi:hypothetical protein
MNDASEFRVGSEVAVREEYRASPSLRGNYKGTVVQVNRVGITMVYTVILADTIRVNITHGALSAAQ